LETDHADALPTSYPFIRNGKRFVGRDVGSGSVVGSGRKRSCEGAARRRSCHPGAPWRHVPRPGRHRPFHPDNIAAQRNLNDKGKALAKAFGEALRQIGAPVGKVYTSLFNRAYETGVLAGFTDIEKTADITEGGLVVSPNENNRRAEALRKMLGVAPMAGTNTVIITHKPNIVDALGKDWFDVKEGEASIFRPENGIYHLVARVQMDEWPRLAATK
jgi:phosphohistidine phosphatase SixA